MHLNSCSDSGSDDDADLLAGSDDEDDNAGSDGDDECERSVQNVHEDRTLLVLGDDSTESVDECEERCEVWRRFSIGATDNSDASDCVDGTQSACRLGDYIDSHDSDSDIGDVGFTGSDDWCSLLSCGEESTSSTVLVPAFDDSSMRQSVSSGEEGTSCC
jgi:hypothetical protein